MKIKQLIMITAVFLLAAFPASPGDLTINNLTVVKDATIYGRLNLCSMPTNPAFINGLAGYWPLNGNANDLSGNNNHGAIIGNVTLTADRFGMASNACQFNGNGYIRVPNSSSLCIPRDVSMSVWIKAVAQRNNDPGTIVQKGSKHDRNYELAIDHGDRITWSDVTHGKKNWRITGKKGVSDGKWHHIVGNWDGQTVKLYVDGMCEAKEQCSSSRVPNSEPLFIGCDKKKDFFNGAIDDLQIYNRALSESEVFSLYNYSMISNPAAGTINALQLSVLNGISQSGESATNVFMGKVGIGTGNPAEKLHVAGNIQVDGALKLGDETRTNWPNVAVGALIASNNLSDVADKAAARANLGLGTAATRDATAFDSVGAADAVNNTLTGHTADVNNPHQVTAAQVGALTPTSDGSQLSGITASQVGAVATNGDGSRLTGITAEQVGALSTNGGFVATLTTSNGINQSGIFTTNIFMGNVGIGTNNPAEKLHVAGNIRVDGTSIVSALKLGDETKTSWSNVTAGLLTSVNNLSDVNASAARTNLGLGSAAIYDASSFLSPTGNGSQLTGITAAQVGALTPAGDGSRLTGITAAQVGALAPNGNGSQLTGITAAQVGALSTTGGVVNGTLNVTSNLIVNGTNVADLIGSGAFNPMNTNLDMATNRIVNLAMPVNPNDAASKHYLWTSLSNIPPMGDLSMGVYTNY